MKKIRGKALATGALALMAIGTSIAPADARPLRAPAGDVQPKAEIVKPDFATKSGHGFPAWYQDKTGLKLELCLETGGMCVLDGPGAPGGLDPNRAPYVETLSAAERQRLDSDLEAEYALDPANSNFEHEHFWYNAGADAVAPQGSPVTASLVYAVEAAFSAEEAVDGDQMTFGRIRFRLDGGVAGTAYTFVHPHGKITLTADDRGQVRYTEDIGCTPGINALFNDLKRCDFTDALHSPIMRSLPVWDTFDPAAGAASDLAPGYVGDPTVPHAAKGGVYGAANAEAQAANGNALFVVLGDMDVDDDPSDDRAEGDQWSISGKVAGSGGGGTGGGVEPAPTDTVAPEVVSIGRATNNANTDFVVTFSEPVDPTTVDKSTIKLAAGGRDLQVTSVALSDDGLTATLNPRNNLANGTRYRLTVTDGVQDPAGNALAAIKSQVFRG